MDIHEYFGVLRRGWALVVLGLLVGVAGGLAANAVQPRTYAATSREILTNSEATGDLTSSLQASNLASGRIGSYVLVATSGLVLQPVIDELKLDMTVEQLAGNVSVVAPAGTLIVEITASAATPELAKSIANTVSAVFSDVIENQIENAMVPAVGATDDTDDAATDAAAASAPVRIVNIEHASLPTGPTFSNAPLLLAVGAIMGLALGLVGASLRESLDRRIRGRKDVAAVTERPILGQIRPDRGVKSSPIVMHTSSQSAIAESFRGLRASVEHVRTRDRVNTFVITAMAPRQGASLVAANLALAIADTATTVVVVDANLQAPHQAEIFDVDAGPGLTDLLTTKISVDEVISAGPSENIWVVPIGSRRPKSADLLATARMRALLTELQQRFDVVIIDTTAISTATDATVLGSFGAATLLVVAEGTASRPALAEALNALAAGGSIPAGVVLNQIPRSTRTRRPVMSAVARPSRRIKADAPTALVPAPASPTRPVLEPVSVAPVAPVSLVEPVSVVEPVSLVEPVSVVEPVSLVEPVESAPVAEAPVAEAPVVFELSVEPVERVESVEPEAAEALEPAELAHEAALDAPEAPVAPAAPIERIPAIITPTRAAAPIDRVLDIKPPSAPIESTSGRAAARAARVAAKAAARVAASRPDGPVSRFAPKPPTAADELEILAAEQRRHWASPLIDSVPVIAHIDENSDSVIDVPRGDTGDRVAFVAPLLVPQPGDPTPQELAEIVANQFKDDVVYEIPLETFGSFHLVDADAFDAVDNEPTILPAFRHTEPEVDPSTLVIDPVDPLNTGALFTVAPSAEVPLTEENAAFVIDLLADEPVFNQPRFEDWAAPAAEPASDPAAEVDDDLHGMTVPEFDASVYDLDARAEYEPSAHEDEYDQPIFEQPVFARPVYEQPVFDQPRFEQPVFDQPVFAQPVYELPVLEDAAEEPLAEEPAFVPPVDDIPMVELPVLDLRTPPADVVEVAPDHTTQRPRVSPMTWPAPRLVDDWELAQPESTTSAPAAAPVVEPAPEPALARVTPLPTAISRERLARESYMLKSRELERAAQERLNYEQERLEARIREQLEADRRQLAGKLDELLEDTVMMPRKADNA